MSWKIGSLFGIAIRIHATFPLLLVWIATIQYAGRKQWSDVAAGLGFTIAIFCIVVLHELGHALTARKFKIRTRDITLLPIGGVARLERMPTNPVQELWIALAGPAVNVALAILLFAFHALRGVPAEMDVKILETGFIARLAWVNVGLAVFNLLPAFPMDGGRVLRAVLALRIDFLRATNIAAGIGRGLAVAFGIVGLASNPLLFLIAIFIWFGAEQESGATRLRVALAGVPVEDVMMTEFHVLSPDDVLQRAVDFALASRQQHFPVVADEVMVGMLCWDDLVAGISASGPSARVADKMRRPGHTARPTETVTHLLDRARNGELRAMPVLKEGKVVGLFTAENLVEAVMLRTAAEGAMRRPDAVFAERS